MHDNTNENYDYINTVVAPYDIMVHARLLEERGILGEIIDNELGVLFEQAGRVRSYATYLECYADSHILIFLTHAAVEVRRFFKDVFLRDFHVCILPPLIPDYMSVREADEFVLFDSYMFLVKMGRSMGLSYPQFGGHLRKLGDDIKRMYGSRMTEPAYVTAKNRRDYVFCRLDTLEVTKADASWECECEPVQSLADPVAVVSDVSPAFVSYVPEAGVDNKHGQMKLLAVEMRFLEKVLLDRVSFDAVLYLGSSPGDHIGALMQMFPSVRWYAYDIKPAIPWDGLDVIPDDDVKFGRLANLFSDVRKRVVVINDIFIENTHEFYKTNEQYYEEISQYADIVYYMEKYFIEYTKPLTRVRTGSELWFQPFQSNQSFELRQVFRQRLGFEVNNRTEFDNRAIMFRQEIRPNVYVNGRCYDCHYMNLVVKCAHAITGVDMSKDVWKVYNRKYKPPVVWSALLKFRNKARLKACQKGGFRSGGKVFRYDFTETPKYDVLCLGGKSIRIPKEIGNRRDIFKDIDPPEVISVAAKAIVVNDDFVLNVPPYVLTQQDELEVQFNRTYECLPAQAPPSCIICCTPGASFTPRLDLFGRLVLKCGSVFVKTGIVRKEFVPFRPPDLWDSLSSYFSLWE